MEIDDDDISLKGFVSEAVRRESLGQLPHHRRPESQSSLDSYGENNGQSTSEDGTTTSASGGYLPDDESMEEEEDSGCNDRNAVDDLLDAAMDETSDDYDPDMDPKNVVLHKRPSRSSLRAVEQAKYEADMDIKDVVMRRKPQQNAVRMQTIFALIFNLLTFSLPFFILII